jgi:hypothetical protein
VFYRETKIACLSDDVEIVEETPEGITVRHTYRKGKRLEFIPREKLEGIVYEDIKPNRKPRKAKVAKPTQEITVEGDVTVEGTVEPTVVEQEPVVAEEDAGEDIFSESEDFDDDGDDFDDDEFE